MITTEPETTKVPLVSHRKTSLAAGTFYLLTFVSIPTLFLCDRVQTDAGFITGPGPDTLVVVGGLLEVIVALACIGTGVALYPVVKRQNEGVALGFVGARILEAGAIFAGVAVLKSIVTLRQARAGEEALITGQALLAQHARTTLLGQSLIPAFNALLLGSLMYKSRLLPRALPVFGLIGAPLLIAGAVGMLFGLWGPVSPLAGFGALFLAIWEFGMGIWLVLRGFNPDAVARLTATGTGTRGGTGR
ncbi:DUF4386 domain-containing protein [Arthrobacter oryzae]|jgi:hypothetical protein|uniref:DUF4386 domain-containing protein n=1 Tax=Arthrobacter oryzae TaxID=409290 RepID=UPI0027803AEF|nr:DUF4386 domain-containing protein [Arthrobacter oryzae]MDQ0079334.1 hypothetical protein [Arthrobacter oryzae]